MEIDLRSLPANQAGELLRNMFFAQDESHFGGYSTFELRPAVERLVPETRIFDGEKEVWTRAVYHGIIMRYHWDGDGCLEFLFDNHILSNNDCKKANRWEWL